MEVRTRPASVILGVGLLALSAAVATAQQPSITKTTQMGQGETTTSTRTVNATVVSVDGNKVVGRDATGKTTEYTIPEGFKFQYQGREIGVSELKPGMQVSAKITTTTTMTPVYVSEIRTGKVLAVSGDHIIVKGPQGNRQFSNADAAKRNAKIMRDGKEVALSDLRPGDNFTAVIVTDAEPKIVSDREAQAMVSGGAPPPAPAAAPAPARAPAPAPAAAPAPAPAAPAPAKLPKTASQVPVAGLMGMLSVAAAVGLTLFRRKR